MKRIRKGISPQWFEMWKAGFELQNGRKARYKGDFSTDDSLGIQRRKDLRQQLVIEQGGICCYCMGRIDNTSAHIEHFWPKGIRQYQHLDLDYNNLFASCEGMRLFDENANMLLKTDEFCGHKKENWFDENMIMPTDYKVEELFTYLDNGEIREKSGSEAYIASSMLKNLGLDSFYLNRNRSEAIDEMYKELDFIDIDDKEVISDMVDYYDNMIEGKYVPYCGALVDCLKRL